MLTITLDEERQAEIDAEAACARIVDEVDARVAVEKKAAAEATHYTLPADEIIAAAKLTADIEEVCETIEDWRDAARNRASARVRKIQEKYDAAVSKYHAAVQIQSYVKHVARKLGQDPGRVFLSKSESGHSWMVIWDEGPFEWAISLSGGHSVFGSEYGYGPGTEGDFVTYGPRFYCECQNSYTIVIAD